MQNQKNSAGRLFSTLVLTILLMSLAACSKPPPLKIGFVGGLSGRVADLGIAGRDGAIFAIEQRNETGGINGQLIELIIKDDKQDAAEAKKVVQELIDEKVEAIIGHMTSSMSVVTVPLINQHKVLMVSPTTTTDQLKGIDDHFIRVISHTETYATKSAHYQYNTLGHRRINAVYDLRNKAYTSSWFGNFKKAFEALGGSIATEVTFESSADIHYSRIAEQLLVNNPDGIQIITGAMDAAMISQQLRKKGNNTDIATSEWAATEKLIELGGDAVEGILLAQFFDRARDTPNYKHFRQQYIQRFSHEPGFADIAGYDAATVIMDGLSTKKESQSLKQSILKTASFQGAQDKLTIDPDGDTHRPTYLTQIKEGTFKVIKGQ